MKPRVAMVMQIFPSADNGGAGLRNKFLAAALARDHEVSVYCTTYPEYVDANLQLRRMMTYAVARPADEMKEPPIPLLVALGRRDACLVTLRQDLERHHDEAPFDALVLETCYAGLVTGALPIATVVDEHNIESIILEQWAASRDDLAEARRKQIAAQQAYERRQWGRADAVICVSPDDADHVRHHRPEARVHVVPNGAPTLATPFRPPSQRTGAEILFVGSMNYQPNETAACFLAEEVLPLVRARVPEARLVICGQSPSPRLLALRSDVCDVTGTVPSVEPYLERAAIAAIALRHGAGTSLKAVEAMATGLPLVSTALGVRGLPVAPDQHYVPAETAEEFAVQICRVLDNRAAFDDIARRARVVAEAFDWGTIGASFSRLVTTAIRGPR